MTFKQENLELDVGFGSSVNESKPIIAFYYLETGENKATVEANNYFPKFLNEKWPGGVHIKIVSADKTSASWYNVKTTNGVVKATIISNLT